MAVGKGSFGPSDDRNRWLEEAFTAEECRRTGWSAKIDARIDEFQRKTPFPEEQIQRAEKRAWLAEKLPKQAIGAEIGVFRGHFAEVICHVAKPRLLYLVDPWTLSGETFGWGSEYTNRDSLKTKDAYEEAKLRAMRGGAGDLVMVQGYFPACMAAVPYKLDWAYLDSSHSYQGTVADLAALNELVSPEGVICGDDWRPKQTDRHHGVFRAVQEFTQTSRWKLVMCGYLGQWMLKQY